MAKSRDIRKLKGMIDRPRRSVSVQDMRAATFRRAGKRHVAGLEPEMYSERRIREFNAAEAELGSALRRKRKPTR